MSPFNEEFKENLSFEQKQKLQADTSLFRGWLIDAISELRNAISITNKFGCEAFRKAHLRDPENPDSGVTWESPAGRIGTHGKWGAVTALLTAVIVYMFFHNSGQATRNADEAAVSRADVAAIVDHKLDRIERLLKENRGTVNETKEATK